MNWLWKKLKKYIGEHKFLYLCIFFVPLRFNLFKLSVEHCSYRT